jgi:hypothetical protein
MSTGLGDVDAGMTVLEPHVFGQITCNLPSRVSPQ